ncbi:MAG: Sensory box histidine kinase/response regulator [Spartobacteria bacterium]|nr:Sensory box histidine kinase/response regulator [Spartobacteria bacterium]
MKKMEKLGRTTHPLNREIKAASSDFDQSAREQLSEKLRTPLNAIIGFSELLALQPGSVQGMSDVKHILKAARDLLAIVDQELTNPSGNKSPGLTSRHSNGCDLLYIEDDLANFTLVERILELRPSLTLKHAMTGQMGVETALLERPKLILLDLNLPDIHGAEVLQVLQTTPDTATIPVVILSANATPSQIERLLSGGARNYLTKPFDIDPFLAVVDEFVSR